MTPAAVSALILVVALILFVSEKVRHDLVALLALFACLVTGLTHPADAFAGLADPAVVAVAAILVVGRAVELSGVAAWIARVAIPARAGFTVRLAGLLMVGAALSAFMNNIAALVITMPIATEVARDARKSPATTLMPLAFATILGGMTTLIGTPANILLSSVRETELGAPFGFFTMTPVGLAATVVGLVYLTLIGWHFLPVRQTARREARPPWRVFELTAPASTSVAALLPRLRAGAVRLLALHRNGERVVDGVRTQVGAGDRLLVISRSQQWIAAKATGLLADEDPTVVRDAVTARVVVAHGSFLEGLSHESVRIRSGGSLHIVAVGPRAARRKMPLATLQIEPGDQLFLRGRPADFAGFVGRARLLEIDRIDPVPVAGRSAAMILTVFLAGIAAIVALGISPAVAFLAAAVFLCAARLIPAEDIYRAIDWSIVVLLAAMIPVGRSFETSGAANIAAAWLGSALAGLPLFVVIAALCSAALLLSIFLNNVATAIIMGPLAIDAARLLGVDPNAALLAVLVGVSSDFLTPIGHQNNMLVMAPGGYRFTDYARMGGVLVVLVVLATATVLSLRYG